MFLSEPTRTEYDLNFNFLGFHVRAHPFFFLVCLFIGNNIVYAPGVNTGVGVMMGIVVFFVSILIHEVGHSLAHRRYGMGSRIVLYAMGGMAIPDSAGRRVSLTHQKSIIISLAGPVAGFLLAVVCIALGTLIVGHLPGGRLLGFVPFFYQNTPEFLRYELLMAVINGFVLVNILLNLLNLLPIIPLDGGRISQSTFEIFDKWDGVRKSLMLSIATAVVCGVWCLKSESTLMAIFCFYLAYQNYQQLNPGAGRRW